ncbi:hypothetical protein ACJJIL_11535 [Microbulbifer sp. EKSA005]|uniref:hypothetical protein n=1 Tax=Microbulbifer sp. EKSA005 TaxID=3243364 RepID=UPI004042CE0F
MSNKVYLYVASLFFFMLVGCAAPTYKPNLNEAGEISGDIALVVLTHGRKDKGIGGVFVSYDLLRLDDNNQLEKVAFLQAEKVRLYRPTGDLDKGYYGFMHILEVPEGIYYLSGRSGRGYNSMVAGGGMFVSLPDSNEATPIMMKIELEGGKLNYLGEIVALDKPLINENVVLANRWDRDVNTAKKMIPGLEEFEVVYYQPLKVDADKTNSP